MLDTFENTWLEFLRYKDWGRILVRWDGLPSKSVTYNLFCRELRVSRIKAECSQFFGTESHE
jgi:hypothetical protein